jgi:hypothetical protein
MLLCTEMQLKGYFFLILILNSNRFCHIFQNINRFVNTLYIFDTDAEGVFYLFHIAMHSMLTLAYDLDCITDK